MSEREKLKEENKDNSNSVQPVKLTNRDKELLAHVATARYLTLVQLRKLVFGESLPAVRARIEHDLSQPGVPRDKVVATVVELLQTTLIRVGNERYARENGAYGLTTFRNKHAKVSGAEMHFVFNGKSGLHHEVRARDARVAEVLRRCQEIPGQRLFQYVGDQGEIEPVYSHDVNDYLRTVSDADAWKTKTQLAHEEGLLVGISAGAAVFAALEVARALGVGKNVVTILCDTGERYFSLEEFFPEEQSL